MNAKETAIDLVQKFGKLLALLVIDEIMQTNPTIKGTSDDLVTMIIQTKSFYRQVEEEIEKL